MLRTIMLLMIGALLSPLSLANDPVTQGYDIMRESERRDEGWGDSEADIRMVLRKRSGEEVIRQVSIRALEGQSGEDQSLMEFHEPMDVRGTKFLTHAHSQEMDDQWVYLPSFKRIKRISSKRKTGRFMGSEFTFEDLSGFSLDKNTYQFLGEQTCPGQQLQCFVVEILPKSSYSGYSRKIAFIDKEQYRIWQMELFDKTTDRHVKTLTMADYQQHLNEYWRPATMTMTTLDSGDETLILFQHMRFKTGITQGSFRQNALERNQ